MSATTTENPIPKLETLSEQELRGILIEFGLMKQREMDRERIEAEEQTEREARESEIRRTSLEAMPKVTVEWLQDPQEHSCNVGGRIYRGRGPLKDAAGRKVRRGTRAEIPAPHAVVLEEAGMVEVVDGRERCEGLWSPASTIVMPGVVDNAPAPGDSKAWESLAVG